LAVAAARLSPPSPTRTNGTYTLSFTPTASGKSVVSVKFEGKEIKGSPFTSDVFDSNLFDPARILYDAKVHGYSASTFHQKCDQFNGTVTLVTLKNGAKFGGYNPDNWTGNGSVFKNAPTAFLFSLTDGKGSAPQKFALKPGCEVNAIYCHPGYGPLFGAGLLFLFDDFSFVAELNLIIDRSRSYSSVGLSSILQLHTRILHPSQQHHSRWITYQLGF